MVGSLALPRKTRCSTVLHVGNNKRRRGTRVGQQIFDFMCDSSLGILIKQALIWPVTETFRFLVNWLFKIAIVGQFVT